MQRNEELRPFYPEIKPNSEHMIPVGNLHTMYVASYGNQNGIPAVAVHGGPGSGTQPFFAQFFNPDQYHIILIDQRGAGKSTPKGEMKENTTQLLVEDMELVRAFFKIEQWAVFGGSWGSTLALLYAEAHPQRVLSLIIRGIFLGRDDDVTAFVRDGGPAALLHQNEWENFKAATTKLIEQAGLQDVSVQNDKIYHIYFKLLQHQDKHLRNLAAATIAGWEKFNSYLVPNQDDLIPVNNTGNINTGLTEATYFEHSCFIGPNQILNDIAKLKDIPVYIVQGIYDLVCPSYMADELEAALLKVNADRNVIRRYNCIAGHSHKDEAIRDALIQSLDHFADNSLRHHPVRPEEACRAVAKDRCPKF